MEFFIRFTSSIENDIKQGTSILTNHDNLIVDGLCAFYGKQTIEETIKKAEQIGKSFTDDNNFIEFAIITGRATNGKTGTLGTVVHDPVLVSKHSKQY